MDLLNSANEWVQKGYEISYYIVNQLENGYRTEVESGNMPLYTYTFAIHYQNKEIWCYSVDTLQEGFLMSLEWLNKNIK